MMFKYILCKSLNRLSQTGILKQYQKNIFKKTFNFSLERKNSADDNLINTFTQKQIKKIERRQKREEH